MVINIYEGYTLEEAIQKAKEELGENIKVLHYEITEQKTWIPFKKRKKYKVFIEQTEEETEKFDTQLEEIYSHLEEEPQIQEEEINTYSFTNLTPKNQTPQQPNTPEIDYQKLLEKIETIIDKKLQNITPPPLNPNQNGICNEEINEILKEFTGEAIDLIKYLIEREVDPQVAKEIVKVSCGLDLDSNKMDLTTPTFKEAVLKGIREKITFTGNFDKTENQLKVITFVGPTGVGKTTNLFKIASELIINKDLKVGVISTDTFKVGAVQQARAYSSILNIPFYTITDSKNLKKTLLELSNMDIILIDTVGRSHYDYWRLGEIKEILSGGTDWMEVVLVLSCNYKYKEALEIVNRYKSFFYVSSLLFTKVDETKTPGILLNLPYKTKLPLSYLSTGQRVPEDIKILNPENLTEYILGE
ncbi:MAG: flagellar biosynthesis protein FlhF [Aquificae bacterium]|nr:flagellar biosynthesis protein FlhF [Aquificota bacterium]